MWYLLYWALEWKYIVASVVSVVRSFTFSVQATIWHQLYSLKQFLMVCKKWLALRVRGDCGD